MAARSSAIVCPGQGSQHQRMLEGLPQRSNVDRLLDAAEAMSDLDLRALDHLAEESELADTRVAQPLLYLADWAWGRALVDAGLRPMALAGHSLGEFAALALADVFSVEAGLHLVTERSSLMATSASANPGAMAAVLGLATPAVQDAISGVEGAWLANDNCPGQLVISGTGDGVEAASEALAEAGARRVVPLAVSGGFHSPLMQDAADAFASTLLDAEFSDAAIPVVQNTAPEAPVTDASIIEKNLVAQMTSPVRWTETMATLGAMGVELLVEAGPGSVLSGLAKRVDGLEALSVEGSTLESVIEEVSA